MAYGDWDETIDTFARVVEHQRYGVIAQNMLQLVQHLKPLIESLANPDIVPGTSLLSFCLWLPEVKARIETVWEDEDQFLVRFIQESSTEREVKVPFEAVWQVIKESIQHAYLRD